MKWTWIAATLGLVAVAQAGDVAIVAAPGGDSAGRIAAGELAGYLQKIYPNERFAVAATAPAAGRRIRLLADGPVPEAYEITAAGDEAVIRGGGPRGLLHGVYGLLRQLGCGFSLSGDALPAPRTTPFTFAGWNQRDAPLVPTRIVFDWHNFLSGCSTWNREHWRAWAVQSQKMGYNALMVHAYGNNPMAAFEFDGLTKPVGWLSTTVKGRDWSTMHVTDVRRLRGGQVFDGPAFGADAGLAPDDGRIAAAQALMRGAFADAGERGMDVYFAVDVDTPSANPPELVGRLPESARFATGGSAAPIAGQSPARVWLPNPDTPEGYAFHRAQVAGLMKAYPDITRLVVWFRRGGTPMMNLQPADFPPAWRKEFAAEVARTPEAGEYWHAAGLFAVGKVVRAYDRALKECGAGRVGLAAGTWGFEFLPAADRFLPRGVPLLGLDYDVIHEKPQLGSEAARAPLREIGAGRPVIPIVWAHHDDGHYIGRPYLPLPEFASKLADAKAAGFGIIHWTTRPLDLYFSSLAEQVWQNRRDQPLRATCDDLAERWFGPANRAALGGYLEAWIENGPRFARETGDRFIDRPLTNVAAVVAGCRERLALIGQAKPDGLTAEQRARLDYHRGLEEFIAAFHETHGRFQESQKRLQDGDGEGARRWMAECHPEPVIEQFARVSSIGGITRGEQGLVVSMNTRWLSHIVRHRQALGLDPVRIRFAPTSHDHLAQSRGTFTFHFGPDHELWECWGVEEMPGCSVFRSPSAVPSAAGIPPAYAEVCDAGIECDRPVSFDLRPIMARDGRGRGTAADLAQGRYRLSLIFADPTGAVAGARVFDVAVRAAPARENGVTFPARKARFLRVVGHGNSENDWTSIREVRCAALDPAGTVTASTSVAGFEAGKAADGDPATRWATQQDGAWIQFPLKPAVAFGRVTLDWFEDAARRYRFDLLVSDDGATWCAIPTRSPRASAAPQTATVDIARDAGGPGRMLVRTFDLALDSPGTVQVTLTPRTGKVLICGAELKPL